MTGHYMVYRMVTWIGDGGAEESAELKVCGRCVPHNAAYANFEDIPLWPKRCPEPGTALPPRAVGHHRWGVNLYGLTQCADCGVKAVAVPGTGTFLVIDGEVHRAVPTEDWEEAGAPAWMLGAKE